MFSVMERPFVELSVLEKRRREILKQKKALEDKLRRETHVFVRLTKVVPFKKLMEQKHEVER